MARLGTISFHTCFHTARFPDEYVVQLASAVYTPTSEFKMACHNWLLVEILYSIDNHTIL